MEKVLSNILVKETAAPGESRICTGTVIRGEISSTDDMVIDGRIEGKLISKGKVVIGESATIVGNIDCSSVDFCGNIKGDITVSDVLRLKNTACVNGNIHTRKLQVDLGARFNGSCHMLTPDAPSANPDPDSSDQES